MNLQAAVYRFWLAVSLQAFNRLIEQGKRLTNYEMVAEWVREQRSSG